MSHFLNFVEESQVKKREASQRSRGAGTCVNRNKVNEPDSKRLAMVATTVSGI
jgi:hypothetical protein